MLVCNCNRVKTNLVGLPTCGKYLLAKPYGKKKKTQVAWQIMSTESLNGTGPNHVSDMLLQTLIV